MRFLLVNLPDLRIEDAELQEHLGLAYLASSLRQHGHHVDLIDGILMGWGLEQMAAAILSRPCDVLGISILFQELLPRAFQLVRKVRQRGFRQYIVVGGHPSHFLYREILRDCTGIDSVVLGEGEVTVVELAAALEAGKEWQTVPGLAFRQDGQVVTSPPRPLVRDLDDLPFPARDLLPVAMRWRPVASVLRSRGCYGHCTFCDTRAFYGSVRGAPWRVRSAENVVAELQELVGRYGVKRVQFWDDNFMGPGEVGKERAHELAAAIVQAGLRITFSMECRVNDVEPGVIGHLKEAGLDTVFLGIESGVQAALDVFGKGVTVEDNLRAIRLLQDMGIRVKVGFIFFHPYTTVEEMQANLDFLRRTFGNWPQVKAAVGQPLNKLEVYAGTPIFSRLQEEGRLKGPYFRRRYDFQDPLVALVSRTVSCGRGIYLPLRHALRRLGRRAEPPGDVPQMHGGEG